MIFNCASVSEPNPIRFAGTCSRYSKNAIPQLMMAATYHGLARRSRRCAYQANVMKTFEQASSVTVTSRTRIVSLLWKRTSRTLLRRDRLDDEFPAPRLRERHVRSPDG